MKLTNKRWTALALGGAMLCSMGLTALAADVPADETASDASAVISPMEVGQVDYVLYFGKLKDILRDEQGKLVALELDGDMGKYQMNVNDETLWVDSAAQAAFDPAQLKVGETLYVFHDAASTRSIPPQSHAIAVVRNIDELDAAAMYHEVEHVTRNADGGLTITTDAGGLYISVSAGASVVDYSGHKQSLDQVKQGDRVMAWYAVVLESYPAQAGTDRLMILPAQVDASQPAEGASLPLTLNGADSGLTARYENGTAMVPVAAAAKALGLDVTYTSSAETGPQVTVENDQFRVVLDIRGGSLYGVTKIEGAVGMTGPLTFGKNAYIVAPGTTWAPADLFQMLDKTVTVRADGVDIG